MNKRFARLQSVCTAVGLTALLLPAAWMMQSCSGGGGGHGGSDVSQSATLSGAQVEPAPVQTNAAGTAQVLVTRNRDEIRVTLDTTGLTNVSSVQIHEGHIGENGPVIFELFNSQNGPFTSPLTVTLTSANLVPHPEVGIANFGDAANALLNGNAYITVNTAQNPSGEVRGQIGAQTFRTTLSGTQATPPVQTNATGTATLRLNDQQNAMDVTLDTSNLVGATDAVIRFGSPGERGPVLFTIHTPSNGAFGSRIQTTLTAADLQPQPTVGINTFADAVNAIFDGNAFVEIVTPENPGGALRGQVGSITLNTSLAGSQLVPPVETAGSGTATVRVNQTQDQVVLDLNTTGVDTGTGVVIGAGGLGQSGAVIFPVVSSPAGTLPSETTTTLTSNNFQAQPGAGVNTFGDAINALLTGQTFVTVTTLNDPNGELRGQIGPVNLTSSLSGTQVVPTVATNAIGTGTVSLNGTQTALNVSVDTSNLENPTSATINAGGVGENGPVLFVVEDSSTGPLTASMQTVLTNANFIPAPDLGIFTFQDAIARLLSGGTFLVVTTDANPSGEIRGQIVPIVP
jgi:CHRD domain-containing protein